MPGGCSRQVSGQERQVGGRYLPTEDIRQDRLRPLRDVGLPFWGCKTPACLVAANRGRRPAGHGSQQRAWEESDRHWAQPPPTQPWSTKCNQESSWACGKAQLLGHIWASGVWGPPGPFCLGPSGYHNSPKGLTKSIEEQDTSQDLPPSFPTSRSAHSTREQGWPHQSPPPPIAPCASWVKSSA